MAVLITGAMGHVGFELVRQSAAAGLDIVAQYRNSWREAEAGSVQGSVEWARLDLSDPVQTARLADEYPIEGCIHSAAAASNKAAISDPVAAFRSNVLAVQNLLDIARTRKWRRFINVGTGSVFQDLADIDRPISEDAPISARSVYGQTKRRGEILTSTYRAEYGLDAATVRISAVFGPPVVPRSLDLSCGPIPAFLRAAVLGAPVREASGGDFAASFTHIQDVADGLLAAYRSPILNHDIYHLGSGKNYDTFRVAAAVREAVPGATIEIGPGTAPWTTVSTMRGPLGGDRLRHDTGFAVAWSLEQGIAAFAEWMIAHPNMWH